jgi:hypothetical protein
MRTATLISLAIAAGISDTLTKTFATRQIPCGWHDKRGWFDAPLADALVLARYGGECPNYDWTMRPRVCAGNLIQDEGTWYNVRECDRQAILFCIQHQEFELEFMTWGFPDNVEMFSGPYGSGLWCWADDGTSYGYGWESSFKLSVIQDEDGGPTKLSIRRGRMPHHGNEDRRASRVKADNSWKRHRQTQWR